MKSNPVKNVPIINISASTTPKEKDELPKSILKKKASSRMLIKQDSKPPKHTGEEVTDFANDYAYSLGLDPEILTSQFQEKEMHIST